MHADLLDRIEAYLESHEDVRDGAYGIPKPNEAMQLLTDIRYERAYPPPEGVATVEGPDEYGSVYVALRKIEDGDVAATVVKEMPVALDYDANGKLIGIEILNVPAERLPQRNER